MVEPRSTTVASWFHMGSPVWTFGQLVFVRLFIALKFFWVAALVGPEVVGSVSLALLVLVICEALLDTGLLQAAVQSQRRLTRQDAGAWISLQACRGLLISGVMFLGAPLLAVGLGAAQTMVYIQAVSAVALIKATSSPGLSTAHRSGNFRAIFFIEAVGAFADLAFSIAMLRMGHGGLVVIVGAALGELLKSISSWIFFGYWGRPHLRWRSIAWLTGYGKWVWQSSVLVAVLNQADKIIVSRLLGLHEVGVYQVAAKLAQLALTDLPGSYAQYLFPTLSRQFREAREGVRDVYRRALVGVLCFVTVAALLILAGALDALLVLLGKDWHESMPLVKWMILPMAVGAVITIQVSLARAIGVPQAVAAATRLQFLVLMIAAPLGIHFWGLPGMIAALALAGAAFAMLIERRTREVLHAA